MRRQYLRPLGDRMHITLLPNSTDSPAASVASPTSPPARSPPQQPRLGNRYGLSATPEVKGGGGGPLEGTLRRLPLAAEDLRTPPRPHVTPQVVRTQAPSDNTPQLPSAPGRTIGRGSGDRGKGSRARTLSSRKQPILSDVYKFDDSTLLREIYALKASTRVHPTLVTKFNTHHDRDLRNRKEEFGSKFIDYVNAVHDIIDTLAIDTGVHSGSYTEFPDSMLFANHIIDYFYGKLYNLKYKDSYIVGNAEWRNIKDNIDTDKRAQIYVLFEKIKRKFTDPGIVDVNISTMPTPLQAHSVFYARFVAPQSVFTEARNILEISTQQASQLESLRTSLEKAETDLETLRDALLLQKATEAECRKRLDEAVQKLTSIDQASSRQSELINQQQALHKNEIQGLRDQLTQALQLNATMESAGKVAERDNTITQLRERIETLTASNAREIEDLTKSLRQLQAERSDTESRITALREELTKIQASKELLESKLLKITEEHSQERSQQQRRIIQLEDEVKRLRSSLSRDQVLGVYLSWIVAN